ncbi:3-hydroxyacyl-CoA dehydrogenase family protein [Roseibium sp. Sym1]|uniref:3-hydroxyacyl-CoA dehydrogenase family protein n=1 Tax=Roseibium sp. Sym1 TaxID=3016006 RepID=UPI0022B3170D|nr:3-hydroxyacyl-CoA dehydrogenase family protein [Roseibium sp. Sym1]
MPGDTTLNQAVEGPIGVVGAGTIGRGVAQRLAVGGMDTILVDTDPHALQSAQREISASLRMSALFGAKTGGTSVPSALERIRFETSVEALAEAEFVIENIQENVASKSTVYPRLDAVCPSTCIYIVNSSAIPIERVSGFCARPDQVIGVHFMNPVHLISSVEVIRGDLTSDAVFDRTCALLSRLSMEWVPVKDGYGYVSNRVLMLMINETIHLLGEGAATPADIDRLFRQCFGHKMGPLETADLIGLDTIKLTLDILYDGFGDDKFKPAPALLRMLDAGRLGRKAGAGFHDYAHRSTD